MTKAQVRLDDDVAEVLQRAAERAGHSTTVEANVALRRALGLRPGGAGPRAAVASARAPGAGCPHPAPRRVKGQCMACGVYVGLLASTTRR